MKDMGIIQCDAEWAKPVVVGIDTVYVHSDIKKGTMNDERKTEIWTCHEIQYSLNEFLEIFNENTVEHNKMLSRQLVELKMDNVKKDTAIKTMSRQLVDLKIKNLEVNENNGK